MESETEVKEKPLEGAPDAVVETPLEAVTHGPRGIVEFTTAPVTPPKPALKKKTPAKPKAAKTEAPKAAPPKEDPKAVALIWQGNPLVSTGHPPTNLTREYVVARIETREALTQLLGTHQYRRTVACPDLPSADDLPPQGK